MKTITAKDYVLSVLGGIFAFISIFIMVERYVWVNTDKSFFSPKISIENKEVLEQLIYSKTLKCNDVWETIETEKLFKYRCGMFLPGNTNIIIKKGD